MTEVLELDPFDVERVARPPEALAPFNRSGLLAAADVHVAASLAGVAGERDPAVLLALALAVRAPRLGHVHVDLATIRDTATVDVEQPVDLAGLPWPDAATWPAAVAASVLTAAGEDDPATDRPLRLTGTRLYLDRYWREERRVADDLRALAAAPPADVRLDVLAGGLGRLIADARAERQALAAATAVLRRFAVVAGGPGTGKTTTVARIVALLAEQAEAAGAPAPLVALAAPTGKAAARLAEAVHDQAATMAVGAAVRAQLVALRATTLHRLLGTRWDSDTRFRHHRGNRLPHDVVIVDETSMVSLSLMARLVEAVRPDARLVLVGDPGQLTSIEAGAVLGDVVGPAADGLRLGAAVRAQLSEVTGRLVAAEDPPPGAAAAGGIVVLDHVYRYGRGIGELAEAIRRGDADAAVAALGSNPDAITWLPVDVSDDGAGLAPVRTGVVETAQAVTAAARAGDAAGALSALGRFRVLCAHRRGPHGVATWTARIEAWLAEAVDGFGGEGRWYVGRPLLVTENDPSLRLFNGDTGVVVAAADGHVQAAFEERRVSPARLAAVETLYAMTVHKSQGSQFTTAAVLLPPVGSRLLTRELLYTAVTRAEDRLVLAGTEEAVRAAIGRPIARASGLRERLWGASG